MKIRRLICRSGMIAAFLPLLAVLPSRAQMVTFDPTQSAHALQQIYDRARDAQTWQQQLPADVQLVGTALKDYQQAITTYSMLYGNLKNFNSKSIWRTIESQ